MLVRFNSVMRRIMGDALDNLDTIHCELPADFAAKLKKMHIVEIEGLVVVEDASGWSDDYRTDPTGVECFVNHYHIDRPGDGSLRASAIAGIVAAKEFKRMIEATKIPGDFRVIVSANYNPDPDPPFHGAVVRFHKIRPNNDWLGEDLEAYKREGILTIDWTNPAK